MSHRTTSRFLLLAAAVLFSTGGAAIKAATVTGWQVACFRSGIAALAILAIVPGARRGWRPRMALAGLTYAATLILFVLANRLTTAANTIFLQSTAPLYLLIIGPLLLKEPVKRSDIIFAGAVGVGLSLFFFAREHTAATAPDPFTGNLLALISGVTWAGVVASLRWLGRGTRDAAAASATVVVGNLMAFGISLPMALPISSVSASDVGVLLYLGMFQVGLAYWCMTRGLRHVPAFEAATLMLIEPVLNPVWAWLVHGERPATLAIAGGSIILASTLVSTWRKSRA
ncbi:MAG TPA: DMT family transporter [Bryobacteraceae bacterium]|nr:DMT family transporter [Bryobacteraceae bacterium]